MNVGAAADALAEPGTESTDVWNHHEGECVGADMRTRLAAAVAILALFALACTSQEPNVPTEAQPGMTAKPVCDIPHYRPTYLPWLDPGEAVPGPARDVTNAGGGPQGINPGYSMLVWGFGDISTWEGPVLEGTIALWRSTRSVSNGEPDPTVPRLPDGSMRKFFEGENGDWAINGQTLELIITRTDAPKLRSRFPCPT